MRADRLVATLLFMQTRGRVTAADIATELEVSLATARRDLEALSVAGVPVYAVPGRGGGWSLVGGARTDLSGLTAAEAQALFLVAGPATGSSPFVTSALRKLMSALPAPFRTDAGAAADAVVFDPAGWGRSDRERPETVRTLQTAVVRRRTVVFAYRNRAGRARSWRVDPWGLVDKDEIWYLLAGADGGQRTFRVDRITDLTVTDDTALRPDDFDLATAWSQVVTEVEQQRSLLTARVSVAEGLVFVLQDQFGRHCTVMDAAVDGRVTVGLAAPTALMIAQPLAGWGDALEVLEPASVRAELLRLGRELVSRYGDREI